MKERLDEIKQKLDDFKKNHVRVNFKIKIRVEGPKCIQFKHWN